jgi:hypothetical protein
MDIYRRSEHKSKLLNYSEIHLFGIEIAFNEMREYYDIIENGLSAETGKKIKKYNHRLGAIIASNKEEGWAAHVENQYYEEVAKLDYYFPHAFRSSFLIQIFSFIEFELKEICNHHHITLKTDVAISDFKGTSDLDKAKIYLTKICKIQINDLKPEWDYLLEIRKIRNVLVHYQGIIKPDQKERNQMLKFIANEDGVEIKEQPTDRRPDLSKEDLTIMVTGRKFNETLLANAEAFFKKLLDGNNILAK